MLEEGGGEKEGAARGTKSDRKANRGDGSPKATSHPTMRTFGRVASPLFAANETRALGAAEFPCLGAQALLQTTTTRTRPLDEARG